MPSRAETRRGERLTTVLLVSCRLGPSRRAIIELVGRTGGEHGSAVRVEECIAVVDNEPVLRCQKPIPMQPTPAAPVLDAQSGHRTDDFATRAVAFLCGAYGLTPGGAFATRVHAP